MIIDDPILVAGVQNYLTKLNNKAARDVILIATDHHPTFHWYSPAIAHIEWNRRQVLNRVVRWVNNVARGKDDRKTQITEAILFPGDVACLQD